LNTGSDYDYFVGRRIRGKDNKIYGIVLDYADMYMSIRKRSKHFFRKYFSWGFDLWVLELLEASKVKYIGIIELEDKKVYVIPVEAARVGCTIEAGQIFIPEHFFAQDTYDEK
jgi:hypothetical protein